MIIKNIFASIFEPSLVEEIYQYGEVRHYKEGEIIIEYGKIIRIMPIVVEGTIKVFSRDDSGKEILLYYLSSNDSCSFAYSCCMEAKKSEIKAIADEDVELIAIPHQKLEEWL